MMSHMFVEVDEEVDAQDEVILYNNDIRIDEYTFKGVGANSEQLSAMNHDSLIRSIDKMAVKYNDYGELTMAGTSLKTLAQSFGTPTIVYDEDEIRNQMRRYHSAFQKVV